jgi:hypothetical protein
MKTTNKTMWLTVETAKSLINKVISWRAPMDEENWENYDTPKFYGGKCKIKEINSDNRRALKCETISGYDLSYALLEKEELQPVNGSETRFSLCPATGDKRTFTYSDLYREVEIIDIKETEAEDEEEHADNIIEVMFEGDKTTESKQFESNLIEFFKMKRLNAGAKVQQIIKANYDDRTQLSGVYGVDEVKKIERLHISLSAFIGHISDMIGFEIAGREQTSDSITLINESGFKLSATVVEA